MYVYIYTYSTGTCTCTGTCSFVVVAYCHDVIVLCVRQVVPLSSVLEYRDTARAESLRSLALSVYTQCRRQVSPAVSGRSLTGFGPAAAAWERLLKPEVSAAIVALPPLPRPRRSHVSCLFFH